MKDFSTNLSKKILITGSTGFVGSHLAHYLTKLGYEVFCLVRSPEKAKKKNIPGTLIQGSLANSNKNEWVRELPHDLAGVIHTAGIVHSFEPREFTDVNALGTKILVQDLKEKYETFNFVLISSLAAGGPTPFSEKAITEKDKDRPVSEYGQSKLQGEHYLKELLPKNWKSSVIRPPMVIGPGDPAMLDVFKMVKGRVIFFPGLQGKHKNYSFISVFDLVNLIEKSLKNLFHPQSKPYNVFYGSFGNVTSYQDLIKEIQNSLKIKRTLKLSVPLPLLKLGSKVMHFLYTTLGLNLRLTPDKINEIAPDQWICSPEKARRELSFEGSWDLKKTVHITTSFYKENKLL